MVNPCRSVPSSVEGYAPPPAHTKPCCVGAVGGSPPPPPSVTFTRPPLRCPLRFLIWLTGRPSPERPSQPGGLPPLPPAKRVSPLTMVWPVRVEVPTFNAAGHASAAFRVCLIWVAPFIVCLSLPPCPGSIVVYLGAPLDNGPLLSSPSLPLSARDSRRDCCAGRPLGSPALISWMYGGGLPPVAPSGLFVPHPNSVWGPRATPGSRACLH